jgi:phosphoglucomutase
MSPAAQRGRFAEQPRRAPAWFVASARDVDGPAGELAEQARLVSVLRLVAAQYRKAPDPSIAEERVAFGKSGHRGSAWNGSFKEAHVLSISQAICDFRKRQGIYGPLFLAVGTNAVSKLAFATLLEVLAANDVEVLLGSKDERMPARAVSHAIRTYNRSRAVDLADGIAIAAPRDSPEDGGFKYVLPNGDLPDLHAIRWIDTAANEYLLWGSSSVRRLPYEQAVTASPTYGAAAEVLFPHDLFRRVYRVARRSRQTKKTKKWR